MHAGDAHILVVEDDPRIREALVRILARAGYRATTAGAAGEALTALRSGPFDLVLLDLGLPDQGGLELLADVRETSSVPVIIVTGRAAEGDRVLGLRSGADDYVVKPPSPDELVARVEALLRRAAAAPDNPVIAHGDLEVDTASRHVRVAGHPVEVTRKEFDLLATLLAEAGRVVPRSELLRRVWSTLPDYRGTATITEHMRRLRRKLGTDPARIGSIVTVPGVGYRYDPPTGGPPP